MSGRRGGLSDTGVVLACVSVNYACVQLLPLPWRAAGGGRGACCVGEGVCTGLKGAAACCSGMGLGLFRRRSTRFGVPFLVLVVGGSFGLREFAQLRYDFRARKTISKEDAEKVGIKMKDQTEVTLETEYEKIVKIDTSNWENVRGPRPWEEGNKLFEEAKERAKKIQPGN